MNGRLIAMRLRAVLLAMAMLTGACGGKVAIDGTGGALTGGTAGGDPAICDALCSAMAERNCGSAGCVASCASALAGECKDALTAAVACLQELIPPYHTCPIQGPCEDELLAYQTCLAPAGCTKTIVTLNEASYECFSRAECPAGEVAVECDNQTHECTCLIGGDIVGSCHEDGPLDCNLFGGCCAPLLVPPGG